MELIDVRLDFSGQFGDKRLDKRASSIQQTLLSGRSSSIHSITKNESEQKAFYRFVNNEKVTESKIIECMQQRAGKLSEGREFCW